MPHTFIEFTSYFRSATQHRYYSNIIDKFLFQKKLECCHFHRGEVEEVIKPVRLLYGYLIHWQIFNFGIHVDTLIITLKCDLINMLFVPNAYALHDKYTIHLFSST